MAQANLLMVEDEDVVARQIKSRLEKSGYKVCALVHDGKTALARAEELRPDLVLMGTRLKGEMDGIETASQIRERFNLPVVHFGAYTNPARLERAKRVGLFGSVAKPLETQGLMVSIEMALNRHHSESERIYREKLKVVLETTGAICHELSQPMMTISGQSELLLYTMDQSDPAYEKIAKIQSQVQRMSAITQKLMGITRDETKTCTKGGHIEDIEKSCMTIG